MSWCQHADDSSATMTLAFGWRPENSHKQPARCRQAFSQILLQQQGAAGQTQTRCTTQLSQQPSTAASQTHARRSHRPLRIHPKEQHRPGAAGQTQTRRSTASLKQPGTVGQAQMRCSLHRAQAAARCGRSDTQCPTELSQQPTAACQTQTLRSHRSPQ